MSARLYELLTEPVIAWLQRRELSHPGAVINWGFLWLRLRRVGLWLYGFQWNEPHGLMRTVISLEEETWL